MVGNLLFNENLGKNFLVFYSGSWSKHKPWYTEILRVLTQEKSGSNYEHVALVTKFTTEEIAFIKHNYCINLKLKTNTYYIIEPDIISGKILIKDFEEKSAMHTQSRTLDIVLLDDLRSQALYKIFELASFSKYSPILAGLSAFNNNSGIRLFKKIFHTHTLKNLTTKTFCSKLCYFILKYNILDTEDRHTIDTLHTLSAEYTPSEFRDLLINDFYNQGEGWRFIYNALEFDSDGVLKSNFNRNYFDVK